MKKYTFIGFLLACLLWSCSNEGKEARARLNAAAMKYEGGEYSSAKSDVDSLRSLYPKQLAVLKDGLELMRKIELAEAYRAIAFCDSLLPIKREEAAGMVGGFILEKDTLYQETGNYVWKQQTIERNVERCYIRSRVNEKGEMFLESVYYGQNPIRHTHFKVSTTDGQFAGTAVIPYDGGLNYRFENMGNHTEVVTYGGEAGVDVVKFIYAHVDERIRVEYLGDRPYVIYMTDTDKKALMETYDFAIVLNDINNMETHRDKALKRVDYLNSRLNND